MDPEQKLNDEQLENRRKYKERILRKARHEYGERGIIEIDMDARLAPTDDGGCWVEAWVWISLVDLPELS